MKKFLISSLLGLLLLALSGCNQTQEKSVSREVFALDTISSISIWTNQDLDEKAADEILKNVEKLILYYDKLLSRTQEGSDVYRANHAQGAATAISLETAYLIQESIRYAEETGGYFDITILPVKDLWDFKADHPEVPSEDQIQAAKSLVNYRNIDLGTQAFVGENDEILQSPLDTNQEKSWVLLQLKKGATIDLGAIAKGYIADKVGEYLKSEGVNKGIINLGGNVLMVGEKEAGTPWTVGVQSPDGVQNSYIATVSINDESVVTSGVYERYFEIDGIRYHHLLDPYTGKPVDNGLLSVTILSEESVVGDALSTSCFVLGLEKGLTLIEKTPGVEAVFALEDGDFITSSGINKYSFTQKTAQKESDQNSQSTQKE